MQTLLAFFTAIATFFGWMQKREERQVGEETRQAGATDASNETQIVISDIVAERADLPPASTDAAVLVASLRKRARADRARSGDLGAEKP